MSPVFHNDNSHVVTARDEKGQEVRLEPGRAASVDGKAADTFQSYADDGLGLRVLDGEDASSVLSEQRRDRVNPEVSAESRLAQEAADARREITRVQVSAPLQVVVGDDQAPYGPPSGTVSTKQAEAAKSDQARRQFADHEPLIGERVEGVGEAAATTAASAVIRGGEVHNAQESNRRSVEDAVASVGLADETASTAGDDDGDDEDGGDDELPRGQALDAELERAGLPKSGSVAEKQQRLAEYRAQQASQEG